MKYIILTKGQVATVCDCHYELIKNHKWTYATAGYAVRRVHLGPDPNNKGKYLGKIVLMHRQIMNNPKNKVDHKDHDGLNNQCSNLRMASQASNLWNRPKQNNNKSGYKGVSWSKQHKKWIVQIVANGKHRWLGTYSNLEEAAEAYKIAAQKYHGEFAWLK